jgi:Catalase
MRHMPPGTDWKETIPDGEAAQLEAFAEELRALQKKRARGGPAARALHAKGQAGVEAEFEVLADLPEHARVGLFATPGKHRAYVRFSNGMGIRQSDRRPDVRGIAIKVLGVPGRKIIPGLEDATTQDFLLIGQAATPFRDAAEFVWFVRAAASPALFLPRILVRHGPIGGVRLLRRLLAGIATPVTSVATLRYYSALPIRFGAYAVHYALGPRASEEPGAKPGKTPGYLTEELAARLARGPVAYDFRVQFFVDDARTPIEDASREWKEADAPFVTVARLTLPRQDLGSARGRRIAEYVEKLAFDPWHAPADFHPLGNMMRARNHAYRLSTMERGAAPEPDGSESFD